MNKQKRNNFNNISLKSKRARHNRIIEIEDDIEFEKERDINNETENTNEVEDNEAEDNEAEDNEETEDSGSEIIADENDDEVSEEDNKNGVIWAKCKYCSNVKFRMDGKSNGSTGNLNKHLKNHMDKIDPSVKKQAEFMKKFLGENKEKEIAFSNAGFRENLAIWVASDDQPFTVTEGDKFQRLIKLCNAKVEIPSADTNVPGKLSFTLDCWTSTNTVAFLGITCHYIDINWNLHDILVDFVHLSGSHTGENLAKAFLSCVDNEFNIFNKILAITADNAANNTTLLKELENVCGRNEINFNHKRNHVRCLAHIINLTSQEILRHIKAASEVQEENDILTETENSQSGVEVIPKLRKLIFKINLSPQQSEKFAQRSLKLKDPLNDIAAFEHDLKKFLISSNEWDIIEELCRIFEKFYKATEYMSMSKYITLSSSVPMYNMILEHIENLLDENHEKYCHYPEIRDAITKGYEKLKLYYSKTDDSQLYTIATILDPRLKLNYYKKQQWEQKFIDSAKLIFINTFKSDYASKTNIINDNCENNNNENDFLYELFGANNNNSSDEFEHNEEQYPRLSIMARDYLGIPGTSVPVERIFSRSTDLITKKRSSLNNESIQACMCIKNWIDYM
ncbi:ribonuclease H-like protein [Rhizophagus irregularis DAOM 181602=DAOM 197198]|nr:ribonuclease H-like protein [Rhizophagus irregularis DAOM 181602=DAOM 197198]